MNPAKPCVLGNNEPVKITPRVLKNFYRRLDENGPLQDQSNPHYAGIGNCHNWTGSKTTTGYGKVKIKERTLIAHRLAFFIYHGHFPLKGNALHVCDNKLCLRKSHLIDGTPKDNMGDKAGKKRGNAPTGEKHGSKTKGNGHKMTFNKACAVKTLASQGKTPIEIADFFGVSREIIHRVIGGRTWKNSIATNSPPTPTTPTASP